jgi:sulfur-carrier protein adenylyltransferase/sulfurtransferase
MSGLGFTEEQILRYSRHIILPKIGGAGQRKLLDAKVLCVGAGGLGSPVAMYLAAAGVGTLGIVDFDRVDLTNLQRQLLHDTDDVGRPKVDSAAERLTGINPDVTVEKHNVVLSSQNAMEILAPYDIVVDGSDNFPVRYLVNDATQMLGKPLVYGSIYQFDGQATVFMPGQETPCYRCLFPEPPPPDMAPSCGEAGVLGVLCGVMGNIQANEAIKVLLGIGDTLSGRLLLYDALGMTFTELKVRRDPNCPACSPGATLEFRDYDAWCAGVHREVPATAGARG